MNGKWVFVYFALALVWAILWASLTDLPGGYNFLSGGGFGAIAYFIIKKKLWGKS